MKRKLFALLPLILFTSVTYTINQTLKPGESVQINVTAEQQNIEIPPPITTRNSINFGTNLAGADNWNMSARQMLMVDCFPLSQWIKGTFGTDGWPTTDSGIRLFTNDGLVPIKIAGTYKISLNSPKLPTITTSNGLIQNFKYTDPIATADLVITKNDTTDVYFSEPCKNIKIRRSGYNDTEIFTKEFKENVSWCNIIRTMNLQETNWEPTVSNTNERAKLLNAQGFIDWSSRPSLSNPQLKTVIGIPLEFIVSLGNECSKGLWICFNHKVSDDFVKNALQYIKSNYTGPGPIIIEFSNETWNRGVFAQGGELEKEMLALPADQLAFIKNGIADHNAYYTERLCMFKLFKYSDFARTIYGDADMHTKIKFVYSSQSSNTSFCGNTLNWANRMYPKPVNYYIDMIASAPYLYPENAKTGTVDQIIQGAKDAIDRRVLFSAIPGSNPTDYDSKNAQFYLMAQAYGLEWAGYEIGTDVGYDDYNVDNKVAFALDPRIRDIYSTYYKHMYASGMSIGNQFQQVTTYNKFQWGLSPTASEVVKSPKLAAAFDVSMDDPRTWRVGLFGSKNTAVPIDVDTSRIGLTCKMYGGALNTLQAERIDPLINFCARNWSTGGWFPRKDITTAEAKSCNVVWTGSFIPEYDGTIKFYLRTSATDISAMYINNANYTQNTAVTCKRGVAIPVKINYTPIFKDDGIAYIQLWMDTPDGKFIVPKWLLQH